MFTQIINKIICFWKQNFIFDEKERRQFLNMVLNQLRSGTPLGVIMQKLSVFGHSEIVRKVAQECIDQQQHNTWYMAGFVGSGYFPEGEAEMLVVGEEYNSLPNIIATLVSKEKTEMTFWKKAFSPAKNAIMGGVIILVMLAALATQAELLMALAKKEPQWLPYGEFILTHGVTIIIAIAGLVLSYNALDRNLGETARNACAKWGLFRMSDYKLAHSTITLARILNEFNVAPTTMLAIWEQSFINNPWHRKMVRRTAYMLEEGFDIIQAMENNLVDKRYTDFIRSMAPDVDSEALKSGYPFTLDILETDMQTRYTNINYVLQFIGWTLTVYGTYLVLPTIMGTGLV